MSLPYAFSAIKLLNSFYGYTHYNHPLTLYLTTHSGGFCICEYYLPSIIQEVLFPHAK